MKLLFGSLVLLSSLSFAQVPETVDSSCNISMRLHQITYLREHGDDLLQNLGHDQFEAFKTKLDTHTPQFSDDIKDRIKQMIRAHKEHIRKHNITFLTDAELREVGDRRFSVGQQLSAINSQLSRKSRLTQNKISELSTTREELEQEQTELANRYSSHIDHIKTSKEAAEAAIPAVDKIRLGVGEASGVIKAHSGHLEMKVENHQLLISSPHKESFLQGSDWPEIEFTRNSALTFNFPFLTELKTGSRNIFYLRNERESLELSNPGIGSSKTQVKMLFDLDAHGNLQISRSEMQNPYIKKEVPSLQEFMRSKLSPEVITLCEKEISSAHINNSELPKLIETLPQQTRNKRWNYRGTRNRTLFRKGSRQ